MGQLIGTGANQVPLNGLLGRAAFQDVLTPDTGGTGVTAVGVSGNVLTSDGTGWVSLPGGGGAWTKITANTNAASKKQYITDTTSGTFIVTLPSGPVAGDYVYFMDAGNWATNNLTVARNGSTIEALSSDLVLDVKGLMIQMIYDGTTWHVTSNIGPQGPIGPPAGVGKVIAMAMIFGG